MRRLGERVPRLNARAWKEMACSKSEEEMMALRAELKERIVGLQERCCISSNRWRANSGERRRAHERKAVMKMLSGRVLPWKFIT